MFDANAAKSTLLAEIAKLETGRIGIRADSGALQYRAEYIQKLTKLVAEHVEAMAADASASISFGRIDEEDARQIADTGADIAGQIDNAMELLLENA